MHALAGSYAHEGAREDARRRTKRRRSSKTYDRPCERARAHTQRFTLPFARRATARSDNSTIRSAARSYCTTARTNRAKARDWPPIGTAIEMRMQMEICYRRRPPDDSNQTRLQSRQKLNYARLCLPAAARNCPAVRSGRSYARPADANGASAPGRYALCIRRSGSADLSSYSRPGAIGRRRRRGRTTIVVRLHHLARPPRRAPCADLLCKLITQNARSVPRRLRVSLRLSRVEFPRPPPPLSVAALMRCKFSAATARAPICLGGSVWPLRRPPRRATGSCDVSPRPLIIIHLIGAPAARAKGIMEPPGCSGGTSGRARKQYIYLYWPRQRAPLVGGQAGRPAGAPVAALEIESAARTIGGLYDAR